MRPHLLPVLLLATCRPHHHTLDPVYDCTMLTVTQKDDMAALLEECEGWECQRRAMQLYCEEQS